MPWKKEIGSAIILIFFASLFIGLIAGAVHEWENYQDSKEKLSKLEAEKNNTEPDIYDSERQNNTEPDIHDSEKQNNTEPDIYDSEKQNNTEPDIYDSEKQNNTKKMEFERIVLEIEEQESRRKKHLIGCIVYACAACVDVPIVLVLAFKILENQGHHDIGEGAEACPGLSFFTSRFCPLPREENETGLELREQPPDTAEPSVAHRRTLTQDGVLETAEVLPLVPSTSNDSER